MESNNTKSSDRDRSCNKEFCFVQYLEVLSNEDLKIDNVDTTLSCVRLKWQQSKSGDKFLPGNELELIFSNNIRGLVHIVSTGSWWRLLSTASESKKGLMKICGCRMVQFCKLMRRR